MLTRLLIRNLKRFDEADIQLGSNVVLIGPNNSGKTTALQALALWDIGKRRWLARRGDKDSPEKRPGVTINRRDLLSIPVPSAKLLWRALHTHTSKRDERGKIGTANVRIEIVVEGVEGNEPWSCGLEFDYSNEESFVCRPARLSGFDAKKVSDAEFTKIPKAAEGVKVAYLPPMSGLADREFIKQPGEIGFWIGQGQTAQVLRNLCHQIYKTDPAGSWVELTSHIENLFAVRLVEPEYIEATSEIVMSYTEREARLDLSSAGRGLQQTLLLLAHLYANPETVLLLDEPDAHLEILRQRQTYQLITAIANARRSQIVAASHSEVVLGEAADKDVVVAFVGKPHRIDDRGSQVVKSLKEIGFDQYYLAEETGWVLYLEGSTDLAILQSLAATLEHEAAGYLARPFFHAVANQPNMARHHFYGLREAKPDLVGVAIFDRLDRDLTPDANLIGATWRRREIENYLCMPGVLASFARAHDVEPLFGPHREELIGRLVEDLVPPVAMRDPSHSWWSTVKASDEFLDPLFEAYYRELKLPNLMRKTDYHVLARYIPRELIDVEIGEKLDMIVRAARAAKPVTDH